MSRGRRNVARRRLRRRALVARDQVERDDCVRADEAPSHEGPLGPIRALHRCDGRLPRSWAASAGSAGPTSIVSPSASRTLSRYVRGTGSGPSELDGVGDETLGRCGGDRSARRPRYVRALAARAPHSWAALRDRPQAQATEGVRAVRPPPPAESPSTWPSRFPRWIESASARSTCFVRQEAGRSRTVSAIACGSRPFSR